MTGISYHLILTYYKMPKIKLKQTRFLQIFGLVALIEQKENASLQLHGCCGEWEGLARKPG